jgi:hypothetical protein
MRVPTWISGRARPGLRAVVLATAAGLLSVGVASHALAKNGNPNPGVLPPHAHAFGATYGEWAAAWAQWYLEVPVAVNPVLDETGENAAEGQSGKVWFLGGNSGYHATTRVVTVPTGKALFFPIINYVAWPPVDGTTEEELRATANWYMDPENTNVLMECMVDGVPLQDLYSYRAESPNYSHGPSEIADLPYGSDIGVADGYWVLLAPLSKGEHVIQFYASIGPPEEPWFWMDVTYLLTVVKK